jgi:predicted RNase H-like nuclease (RuvC/YqgF family)
MKKKEKKLKKKLKKGKEKLKLATSNIDDATIQRLTNKIKTLKSALKEQDELIGSLQKRLKKSVRDKEEHDKKSKQQKAKGSATKLLRTQQTAKIGVTQRQAWKQHGFLRDRYEFHLVNGEEKTAARALANQDLCGAFGDEAGYSEEELENILS